MDWDRDLDWGLGFGTEIGDPDWDRGLKMGIVFEALGCD